MDIAGLSMGMAQSRLMNDVGVAVLAKSLDTAQSTGAMLTDLIDSAAMERAVNPDVGGNIDIRI